MVRLAVWFEVARLFQMSAFVHRFDFIPAYPLPHEGLKYDFSGSFFLVCKSRQCFDDFYAKDIYHAHISPPMICDVSSETMSKIAGLYNAMCSHFCYSFKRNPFDINQIMIIPAVCCISKQSIHYLESFISHPSEFLWEQTLEWIDEFSHPRTFSCLISELMPHCNLESLIKHENLIRRFLCFLSSNESYQAIFGAIKEPNMMGPCDITDDRLSAISSA